VSAGAARLTRLPAGHPEGWLDTLVNLFEDFYTAVGAARAGEAYEPSLASFADAHRIQLIVEAVLASDRLDRPVSVGT
jgi:predicted dehydrogenase